MRKTRLGELEVSVIGLGCMGMSQGYGEADPAENARTLNRALDRGITFLDTANAYGNGRNETLLGEVLAHRRDEFVLATKFAIVRHADGSRGIDCRPEQVATRCDESLARLKTDRIDLYYMHRLDPNVPVEDTVGAMAELVAAGKVRYLGLSEVSSATIRRAHAVHPITAVQSEYSLWTRDPVAHVIPTCRELGIGFVPFSPLGRAMLTGRVDDGDGLPEQDLRHGMPRFTGDNFRANRALVGELERFAGERGWAASQVALAWLLAQGEGMAPIPGTKQVRWLEEDLGALDVALTPDDMAWLDQLFAPERVRGHRYTPSMNASIDSDEQPIGKPRA
ncbi:MAG: aldo/keto reductase [Gammaproteobacteria bacterium]|nr:aldo/keto reductase [Gammaproteobacteria bacterium]